MVGAAQQGPQFEAGDLDELVLDGVVSLSMRWARFRPNANAKPYAPGVSNNGPVSTATVAQPLAALHQAVCSTTAGGFNARWLHEEQPPVRFAKPDCLCRQRRPAELHRTDP